MQPLSELLSVTIKPSKAQGEISFDPEIDAEGHPSAIYHLD